MQSPVAGLQIPVFFNYHFNCGAFVDGKDNAKLALGPIKIRTNAWACRPFRLKPAVIFTFMFVCICLYLHIPPTAAGGRLQKVAGRQLLVGATRVGNSLTLS